MVASSCGLLYKSLSTSGLGVANEIILEGPTVVDGSDVDSINTPADSSASRRKTVAPVSPVFDLIFDYFLRPTIQEEIAVPESCPICGSELHSIVTRRLGDDGVCINCGDALIPLLNAISTGIITRAQDFLAAQQDNGSKQLKRELVKMFARNEIDENFAPLITGGDTLKAIL